MLASCGNDVEFNDGSEERSSVNSNCNNTALNPVYGRLEFPRLKGGDNNIVLIHNASFGVNYCVEWDTNLRPEGWDWSNDGGSLRSQRWSCWQWHAGNSSANTTRKPYDERYSQGIDFTEYPNNPNLSRDYHFTVDPYRYSGYDHGHIMASADRGYGYNPQANIQTFYMTNMQPQNNPFNSGIWTKMEMQAREWNNKKIRESDGRIVPFRDTLYIVKGGTIDKKEHILRTIGSGRNRIPVPKYFFMAILCKNGEAANGGYKALGFWIAQDEHKSQWDETLQKYVCNIDELEEHTGIDFFCNLPDNIEDAVERLPKESIIGAWYLK